VAGDGKPRGLSGFLAWPLAQYIEEFGLSYPEDSLGALKEITKEMSAEFAVRPFLLKFPTETLNVLKNWANDPNAHVRRLVSEGTRPRLPWGQRLPHFLADPSHCLPLLRMLRDDPEIYVRKSVANHLNDISKDHPDLLVKEMRAWLKGASKERRWVVRHACRSLIKAGHGPCLDLLGFSPAGISAARLNVSPQRLILGGQLALGFTAIPTRDESWLIDYAVHHRKANGRTSAKVFKWKVLKVQKGKAVEIQKKHAIRVISTRRYYDGKHAVEILVNGQPVAKAGFWLNTGNKNPR
jgi:3-methyladenine DNA glycosylase AlkC